MAHELVDDELCTPYERTCAINRLCDKCFRQRNALLRVDRMRTPSRFKS